MKRAMVVLPVLSLAVLALTMRAAPGASAQSVGFYPSTIAIEHGLRGQRYEVSTVLINQLAEPRLFTLTSDGDSDGWVQFEEPGAPDRPLTEVTVPPKAELELTVLLDIPESAANGEYSGLNRFDGKPAEGEEQGNVLLSFEQPIAINVTGDQVLDLRATGVSAMSVEAGQPLRIQVPLNNQGNVDAQPQFHAQVYPESAASRAEPVGEIDGDLGTIRPGRSATSTAEWSTAGQEPGAYWAAYAVMLNGEPVDEGEFTFELLPVGAAVRTGVIQSLTVIEPLQAGAIGRADAVFENQGQINAAARFEGQVLKDGVPIAVAASPDALMVSPGELATLSAYFPLPGDAQGSFELRGRVYFEGAQTEEAAAAFELDGGGGLLPGRLVTVGGLAIMAGVVTLAGGWALQRRRAS